MATYGDSLYVTGCFPEAVYLDYGCKLLHRYQLTSLRHQESTLRSDSEALAKKWLAVEWHMVSVAVNGDVFYVNAPMRKVIRISKASMQQAPILSKQARPVPALDADAYERKNSFDLAHGIVALTDFVVVGMSLGGDRGHVMQVFRRRTLEQVGVDLPIIGKVVGPAAPNGVWVSTRTNRKFKIVKYLLVDVKPK